MLGQAWKQPRFHMEHVYTMHERTGIYAGMQPKNINMSSMVVAQRTANMAECRTGEEGVSGWQRLPQDRQEELKAACTEDAMPMLRKEEGAVAGWQ